MFFFSDIKKSSILVGLEASTSSQPDPDPVEREVSEEVCAAMNNDFFNDSKFLFHIASWPVLDWSNYMFV